MSGSSRDVVQAGSVTGGIHFHPPAMREQRDPARPTPRQLPRDVPGFVNRADELRQLDAVVTGADGQHTVVSVCVIAGTAGAGKTSLALHWAHQVGDRFPDGQLYVNLRGYDPGEPVAAQQALRGFLRALGVAAADVPQDVDDAAALYRSLLADRRVLILLDNAAGVGQVRPLLPGSGDSLVVVTSRSRLSGLAVRDGARRLTLGTLPEPEAVALLRAVTAGYRPADSEDRLVELARLCARLPLALRIAAERAASHPHLRLDDLIADLRDESALWDTLSTGSDDEAEAVRTVFAWSYRALSEPAARLFRLLGLHPGPEFGLHAAAALAELALPRARQLLDDLVGAHLLEQTAPDRFQFHDLLRAYATDLAQREEPPPAREEALRRVLVWYLRTADAAQSWIRPDEAHVALDASAAKVRPLTFPDYDSAVDWSEREYANCRCATAAAGSAGFGHLTWQLAVVLWNTLPPSAPVTDWLEAGLLGRAAAEQAGDRGAQTLLLTYLGMAYRGADRLDEALDCLHTALDLARAAQNVLDQAHTLNLIGLIRLGRRQLNVAAEHFGQAVALFREQDLAHWAAIALLNLAGTHLAAGRLPETSAVVEALVPDPALGLPRDRGEILRILAELRLEQGRLAEARQHAGEALEIALALRNHRLEGFWLLTLGNAQRAAGEYGQALASFQRAAMLNRRLGNRSREALAWRGAGETYAAMGRPAEAAGFHRQAAAVHQELGDAWNHAVELDLLAGAMVAEDPEAARGWWEAAAERLAGYGDPRAVALRRRLRERLDGLQG